MRRQFSINSGFTLIEVLAAIAVMIIVGGIIGSIFISSLRGATKATTLTTVRQNGDFAIAQMEKTLRNAQSLTTPASCTTTQTVQSITVANFDGTSTTFACANGNITSNGNALMDIAAVTTATTAVTNPACSFTCTQASATDYPTINIAFGLTQIGSPSFFEQRASIDFKSTVVLRNTASR